MVRFLKSSSMTDQSHPWDSSSCSDSSSRATTTNTKTHSRPSTSLTSSLFAWRAAEATSSLFPGNGGSSNTATTAATNNNTDITKALHNDMSIPKLTAVRTAHELVEDSFNSTISDCSGGSVRNSAMNYDFTSTLYNQLIDTLEHTDNCLTKDISQLPSRQLCTDETINNPTEFGALCLFSELKRCRAENRKSTILSSVPVRVRPKT